MRKHLGSLAVLMACALPVAAQSSWEIVTSKDGQFSVEMPAKPTINKTRTRKGPGGEVKVLILACKSQGATYQAYKITTPTAIVKGAEEAELDETRDYLAAEWNGKVINEKKVRAETRIGRDFTIRGKPVDEAGIVTMRVRAYLD